MTPQLQRTILIVDDDEPTQKLLEAVLRRSGFQTELAADGAQAIALLTKNEYSMVVLDLMMPAIGGREVIAFLAGSSRKPPVIVCTAAGVAASSGLDTCIVRAVIRKPFDIVQLIELVRSLTS